MNFKQKQSLKELIKTIEIFKAHRIIMDYAVNAIMKFSDNKNEARKVIDKFIEKEFDCIDKR